MDRLQLIAQKFSSDLYFPLVLLTADQTDCFPLPASRFPLPASRFPLPA
jgi:hypothetical protein